MTFAHTAVPDRIGAAAVRFAESFRVDTADQAIEMALAKQGEDAEIVLMKNGSDIIPRFAGK